MSAPATFTVHSRAQMCAALRAAKAAGQPVRLISAPGASAYLGAGWFASALAQARAETGGDPAAAWLDCGDRAGDALAALREGAAGVVFTGAAETARRLAAIAEARGAALLTRRPASHDLARATDAEATCRAVFAND
jgi:fructose/tagatose bisphosphate aldolase